MSSWFTSVQGSVVEIPAPAAGSYSDASVVVAAASYRLNPNFRAVLPSPRRSYTTPGRGEKLYHFGIGIVENAGMLAKRPCCAGWASACSLTYSQPPPNGR